MIKICVGGSKGRMGSRIIALSAQDPEFLLTGEFDIDGNARTNIASCDCLIDFTAPEATMAHTALCEKHGKAMVIGTTGLSEKDRERIRSASQAIPILLSPNMSVGVNVLFKVVAEAARALGKDYGVSILEAHHANKKDAPSGTAKELSRVVKVAMGEISVRVDSVREGETVGEHTVTFESPVDVLEFTHSAKTRDIFARGALAAAKFVSKKGPGLYTMQDALGL